ncbi:hypothetical protein M0R45_015899 [Rubus argutus]|uniref:Uncharacterized protein n=1 Tax=Rubus argutus TaxID=59490 RepID=A0AAW1XTJ3_RUBAR
MSSKRKPLSEAAKARLRHHLDFDQFVETDSTIDEVRNTMLNIICPLIFQPGVAQNLPILNGAATSSPRISINEPHTIIPSNTNVESLEFTGKTQVFYDVPDTPDDVNRDNNFGEFRGIYRTPSAVVKPSKSKLPKPHVSTI